MMIAVDLIRRKVVKTEAARKIYEQLIGVTR